MIEHTKGRKSSCFPDLVFHPNRGYAGAGPHPLLLALEDVDPQRFAYVGHSYNAQRRRFLTYG